ncbi:hypothetical protein HK102_011678, partial [Quaeritorhiza haematococci]
VPADKKEEREAKAKIAAGIILHHMSPGIRAAIPRDIREDPSENLEPPRNQVRAEYRRQPPTTLSTRATFLKKTEESMEEYFNRFVILREKLEELEVKMEVKEAVEIIIHGIDEGMQSMISICLANPEITVDLVMENLYGQERIIGRFKRPREGPTGTIMTVKTHSRNQRTCFRCGNRRHLKKDCPRPPTIRCNKCKGTGHAAAACDRSRNVAEDARRTVTSGETGETAPVTRETLMAQESQIWLVSTVRESGAQ